MLVTAFVNMFRRIQTDGNAGPNYIPRLDVPFMLMPRRLACKFGRGRVEQRRSNTLVSWLCIRCIELSGSQLLKQVSYFVLKGLNCPGKSLALDGDAEIPSS